MELNKILIADDSEDMTKTLDRFLRSQGHNGTICCDSKKVLVELCKGGYAVCLLDINMPGLSGIDILKEISKIKNLLTSIVIITGNVNIQSIIEVMRLGACDYLRKPFDMDELGLTIQKAIQTYHLKLENLRYKYYLEQEVRKKTADVQLSFFDIIRAFAGSIQMRDPWTGDHIKKVSEISYLIGKEMGFDQKKLDEIKIGGLLHDIGKIGIADSILIKNGTLTPEEFAEIKTHPHKGYEILKDIESVSQFIPYVLEHHEKFDGTGYPSHLKGEEIKIEGRILSIADALDAMTSDRIYRKKLTIKQAYEEIIRCSGTQFDPKIVDVFKTLWGKNIIQGLLSS